MEPPQGFWYTLWNFICFLPFFIGLLLLGIIKGAIFCPLICLIITIGNTAVILGLWPTHLIWTCYCIARAKLVGPLLKLVLCIGVCPLLISWLPVGIVGSIIGGAGYGFLAPLIATFDAVGEGKTDVFFHTNFDGTWSTVKGSCNVVRDFRDVCYYSYFSVMEDLRFHEPPNGKPYEIRLLHLPGAVLVGALGFMVDMLVISCVAIYKSPYMLFKGWHRLFHDLIGREGPFLETICVPFAGLAILLWPVAVVGAVLASMVSSIFLGSYAGVVVYQESSAWLGLKYIITSLAIYDEYTNDVLSMQEWSIFPRIRYRKKGTSLRTNSRAASFSRPDSFRGPPSRSLSLSLRSTIIELTPLELLDGLFSEYKHQGEILTSEGLINPQDGKHDNGVLSIGLPAYSILQVLLRSINANSDGLLFSENSTEITTMNRPKHAFFDWFLNPLLIIKDQIKALNLSDSEEKYFCKLVLLNGDPERLKNSNLGSPPETQRKQAELDALARRLRGITRNISRFPTIKRRFDSLNSSLSEELAKKNSGRESTIVSEPIPRSRSRMIRIFSQKSFLSRAITRNSNKDDTQSVVVKDVEIA